MSLLSDTDREFMGDCALPTYTGRLAVESDRAWLDEVNADSVVYDNADKLIIDPPDRLTSPFRLCRVFRRNSDNERILWVSNHYDPMNGIIRLFGFGVHPAHRKQGHQKKYREESWTWVKNQTWFKENIQTSLHDVAHALLKTDFHEAYEAVNTNRGAITYKANVSDINYV